MTATDTIKSIQTALNAFRKADPLVVDGIWGQKSQSALDEVKNQANLDRIGVKTPLIPSVPGDEFDARTEKNLATLDWKSRSMFRPFIKAAKATAKALGYDYVAISGNRTWAEQDKLYAQGRTLPGKIVTNARGGQSNHNFGIAMDFGVFQDGKYLDETNPKVASSVHKSVGALAEQFGMEWGGNWSSITDDPHFQIATGLTLAQARERFEQKGTLFV